MPREIKDHEVATLDFSSDLIGRQTKHKQLADVIVSFEHLNELLELPQDHHIIKARITEENEITNTLRLTVMGPRLAQVPEGKCRICFYHPKGLIGQIKGE